MSSAAALAHSTIILFQEGCAGTEEEEEEEEVWNCIQLL
jgi:hypothetical protein